MHKEIRRSETTFAIDMAQKYRQADSPSDRERADSLMYLALTTKKITQADVDLYEKEKRSQKVVL